ncbi:MAG: flagellar motor switch protein FliN [Rhodomicrobium sp.]
MQPKTGQPSQAPAEALKTANVETSVASPDQANSNLDIVLRIPVTLKVLLGSASMPIFQLTKLGRGAVIPLDRRVGEPVDVMVNGQIIARGEIVVLDDEGSRFGVTLTEMIDNAKLQG